MALDNLWVVGKRVAERRRLRSTMERVDGRRKKILDLWKNLKEEGEARRDPVTAVAR